MEKFSVIIPTIWKGTYINELLTSLYSCEAVDEVILINNKKDATPDFPRHEKLCYLEMRENIFVNPAWNLGVWVARNRKCVIAQDDLMFKMDTVDRFVQLLEKNGHDLKNLGFIGMSYGNFFLDADAETIELEEFQHGPGWATIMIFEKSNWKHIPNQLRIWYGDDFIKGTSRPILQMRGLAVKTNMSTSAGSTDKWVTDILEADKLEWNKLIGK